MEHKRSRPADERRSGIPTNFTVDPGSDTRRSPSWRQADVAMAYARQGIPVFPLVPGRKEPLTSHGFLDASTSIEQIQSWWSRVPDANVGAACGVLFDVLDVDVKLGLNGEQIKDGWPALHRLNDAALLSGAIGVARTRHDGVHLFYPPSGLRKGKLAECFLDFQGQGSYVVMPGSLVAPDEGIQGSGRYEWVNELDLSYPGRPLDWASVEKLLRPRKVRQAGCIRSGVGSMRGLARFVASAPEGNRNRALYWAACRAIEHGMPVDDIAEAAVTNGLGLMEVSRTLASARARIGVRS